MATTPQVVSVYPAPDATGIPIGDQVRVVFDQEMDLDSINEGTLVLTGPDDAPVFGPIDVTPLDVPGFDDEDILSSPYFKGYVKATISFSREDASGAPVDDSVKDYTGAGNLWRTVAILTPDKPLKPNVQYMAIILGDEKPADDFDTGVRTRTVFDTQRSPAGPDYLTFHGGYTGDNTREYVVEITAGGPTGDAEYMWWNKNDPLTTYNGITSTGARELEDGIYITCHHDGSFTVGDTFECKVIPSVVLPNTYRWSFFAGSGAILTPPSDSPTSGIESVLSNVIGESVTASSFSVSEVDPPDMEYGVAISTDPYNGEIIEVTFSDPPATATLANAIDVWSEPANGDEDAFLATGELDFVSTLAGSVLTIQLDPGQLYENNIVRLKLDKDIADLNGNALGSDYESYFTTPYTPLYSSLRRIRLDLGPLLVDVPDETIMLAILEASLQADAIRFKTITQATFFNQARRQYTTCLAEFILVRALLGDSSLADRMSKTLGDLSVSRAGGPGNLRNILAQLEDCAASWEVSVQSGGEIHPAGSLKPQYSVKGALAEDFIFVNRQWEPTSGVGVHSSQSAANSSRYASGRRDLRTFRKRRESSYDREYD
jgi:hypothetical protein